MSQENLLLDNVWVLRLDQAGGRAPGNKAFKLTEHLDRAREAGCEHIVSFGGAWSNHLHALAAVGADMGLRTTGIIRGGERSTPMLDDARAWGMELIPVSREEYRRRNQPAYLESIAARFADGLVVPEGGGGACGVIGCQRIAAIINRLNRHWRRVVVAVGTGTTLAGLASGLDCAEELVGVSALKGAPGLAADVERALEEAGLTSRLPWEINHNFHAGGFARVSASLRDFMLAFERGQALTLEPVYTGKAMYAIDAMRRSGAWLSSEPTLFVHTGGLQGRRGFDWLDQNCQ